MTRSTLVDAISTVLCDVPAIVPSPTFVAGNQGAELQEGTGAACNGHYPWLCPGVLLALERIDVKRVFTTYIGVVVSALAGRASRRGSRNSCPPARKLISFIGQQMPRPFMILSINFTTRVVMVSH